MKFDSKISSLAFIMPKEVEKYINKASLAEMRVLIYVFSHEGQVAEVETMAKQLDLEENEVVCALSFWRGTGIISFENENNVIKVSNVKKSEQKAEYTGEDIAYALENDNNFSSLVDFAQKRLQKLFNPSEQGILYSLLDTEQFPCDFIMGVVEYCASVGKTSLRYIEKTALKMREDDGIDSYEKLEVYLAEKEKDKTYESLVRKVVGIGVRALTKSERTSIEKWAKADISEEMLSYAYERTINNIQKPSISYMSKIIEKWISDGIKSPEQLESVKEFTGEELSLDEFAEGPGKN